jgi:hypothetical protein
MSILLSDDGTLDTVLICDNCGQEFRFNYDRLEPFDRDDTGAYIVGNLRCKTKEQAGTLDYEAFVMGAIEDTTDEHECEDTDNE